MSLKESNLKFDIMGGNMPAIEFTLNQGQSLYSGKGAMAWMSDGVHMETSSKGGLFKGFARKFSGEAMFLNTFTAGNNGDVLAFSPATAGEIKHVKINPGDSLLVQKGAFLAAEHSVKMSIAFQKKISAGFFGGEGFVLQKLEGQGSAFLEIDGALVEKTLAPGEVLKVDQGYVAYFDSTIQYEMKMVKGVKNIFLGGEGLLLVKLTGPGKVGLQTLPIKDLAMSLYPYMPQPSNNGSAAGGLLDLFNK